MKCPKLIFCSSLVILFLVLCSCKQKTKYKISKSSFKQIDVKDTGKAIYDSSIILFNDTAYRVNISVFDKEAEDETKANAILILKHTQNGRVLSLTKDSIYTRNGGYVQFADFNNDGIKDLLIFYTDGARANPRFHLYLINNKLHQLIPAKGFEELTNAEFDNKNNIIISVGLSGSDYYSFYRITSKNKLINLGHSFEVRESHPNEHADSVKYDNAIKSILKENKTE